MQNEKYYNRGYLYEQKQLISKFEDNLGINIYTDFVKAFYFHIQAVQRRYGVTILLPKGETKRINPLTYFIEYNNKEINSIVLKLYKLMTIAKSINEDMLDDRLVGFYDFFILNSELLPKADIVDTINSIAIQVKKVLFHDEVPVKSNMDATMLDKRVYTNPKTILDDKYPLELTNKFINEFVRVKGYLK